MAPLLENMEVHIGQRVKRRASVAQTRTTGKEHVLGTVVRAAEKSGWVRGPGGTQTGKQK